MAIHTKITCFFITFLFSATLTGCMGNLGVADEMLAPILSQEYTYYEQPQHVWQAASDIIDSHMTSIKGRVLVRDPDNFTISWFERLGRTLEYREKATNDLKSDKTKPFYESEVLEVGEGGVAITTVCIRKRNNGSLMRIRRVYYGPLTQPRMAHSRGVFAKLFQELVNKELGINADNKTL